MIREKVSYYDKNWKEYDEGKFYEEQMAQGRAYSSFRIRAPKEILEIFEKIDIEFKEVFQTLFHPPPDIKKTEEPRRGFGQGGFVVIKAKRFETGLTEQ